MALIFFFLGIHEGERMHSAKLFVSLVSLGLGLSACVSEWGRPVCGGGGCFSISEPTRAYFEPSGVKPLSVVIPTPGPTLVPKPEVGPHAVYFLRKVSGGSAGHLVYQADLETQQIHTLDTLDFEHCDENNRGITGLSPNRKALLVRCGGTLYIYDTVTRQRIYTTPKKIISMPEGNPVLWPHITVLRPVYPSPVPTQPPVVDEQETFSSAQSEVQEVSITDNFQGFIPTNQGTELLILREQQPEDPFDALTQLVKVKLEDLSVERTWNLDDVYRSPNGQRFIRKDLNQYKMYVSDSLGKNLREIALENKEMLSGRAFVYWQGDDLAYISLWPENPLKMYALDLVNLRVYAFTIPKTVFVYPNPQYPSPTLLDISADGKQVVLYTEEKEHESQWISSLSVLDLETSAVLPLAQTRKENVTDFLFWAKFLPDNRLVYAHPISSHSVLPQHSEQLRISQLEHMDARPTPLFELPLEAGVVSEQAFSDAQQWVFRSEGKHYSLDLNTLNLSEAQLPSWANALIRYTSDRQFALLKEGNTLVSVKVATGERFEIFEEAPFDNQRWIDD